MDKGKVIGHVMAAISITIWGTTFVSTKVLLGYLHPLEVMIYRFVLAYIVLLVIYPKFHKIKSFKDEILFFIAGLIGMNLYFVFELFALELTNASNVALLISFAPIVTAIMAHFLTKDEKFSKNLILGFVIAIFGISLVLFNGVVVFDLSPLGGVLALLAAASTSGYLIVLKNIRGEYKQIYVTRKIFLYGIITSIPIAIYFRPEFDATILLNVEVWGNLLFLSIIASALCFIMWNSALRKIGAVKLSNYTYLLPITGMVSSFIILKEKISLVMILGAVLVLTGTYLSEKKFKKNNLSL